MRHGGTACAVAMLSCAFATPVEATERPNFAVAPGRLDAALSAFARQANVNVGTTLDLSRISSPGVSGRLAVDTALARLLAGTGYAAQTVDRTSFRIVAAPMARPDAPQRRHAPPAPAPAPIAASDAPDIIVVTASKRAAPLLRYPGSVQVVRLEGTDPVAPIDIQDFAAGMPILQTTSLGAGRNKLFVRGVADSSFVGPTRATTSVYFGDVQLGYGGPDPNLGLYDVAEVEVLEGPQGALYGAGSIGGIIRLTPNAPDLDRFGASGAASGSATQSGHPGYDLSGMVNVPIMRGIAALRIVGYGSRDGGYIDDTRRDAEDINSVVTRGGRAALLVEPGDAWSIDLGIVGQSIKAADTQYATIESPHLSRASAIAQPSSNSFLLGRAVVSKDWDNGVRLVSATGIVRHMTDDRYDATRAARPNSPLAYDTHNRNVMITQETRLSRASADGSGWLIGGSVIDDYARIKREFGAPGKPVDITGVANKATDYSGFGEGSIALGRLIITAGGRLTWTRTDGDPSFIRTSTKFIRGRQTFRATPTIAADWLLTPRLAWFARYGEGFRTAGLAVAPGVGRVANYDPDVIRVSETGLRLQRRGETGFSGSASVSYARWTKIQADLIDRNGFPYTTNIGDGQIIGFELTGDWIPLRGLVLSGAMFVNDSKLQEPVTTLVRDRGSMLPNTPRFAGSASAAYRWTAPLGAFEVAATGRYTGHSIAGVGSTLDLDQGRYGAVDLSAGWRRRPVGATIALDNVTDTRGNRFALGNPFGIAARDQITPLRPRTLKLGFTFDW